MCQCFFGLIKCHLQPSYTVFPTSALRSSRKLLHALPSPPSAPLQFLLALYQSRFSLTLESRMLPSSSLCTKASAMHTAVSLPLLQCPPCQAHPGGARIAATYNYDRTIHNSIPNNRVRISQSIVNDLRCRSYSSSGHGSSSHVRSHTLAPRSNPSFNSRDIFRTVCCVTSTAVCSSSSTGSSTSFSTISTTGSNTSTDVGHTISAAATDRNSDSSSTATDRNSDSSSTATNRHSDSSSTAISSSSHSDSRTISDAEWGEVVDLLGRMAANKLRPGVAAGGGGWRDAFEYLPVHLQRAGLTPERLASLNFIHVAGTKGKGSTCAMVESILRRCGYRTGLY
ncbi:hypothetical protein Agub_g14010, partial [Astrephomene gubernaculifera]